MNNVTCRKATRASGAPERHLTVFLEGAQQNSESRPGPTITEALSAYGHVLIVDYPDSFRFRSNSVIDQIADLIVLYVELGFTITFIGVSKGGLIGYDVIEELILRRKLPKKTSLVLIDAPTGKDDLTDKRAWITRWIPQLPTPKWLNRMVLGRDKTMPPHEPFDSPEEEQIWRDHVESSRTFPFLYMFGGQTAYIVRHKRLEKAVLRRVRVVFIQSSNDIIVEKDAPLNWGRATNGPLKVIKAYTKFHADLLEFRKEWARCIVIAMDYVRR